MNSHPLVSVIIPIYNVERYVERCVRSVLEQTYGELELLFVDDASPDGSMDILRRTLDDYPSRRAAAHILTHETNRGLAAARNTGMTHATGEFVCHVDSDDWMEPDAIALLVERQQESGADIVTGLAVAEYEEYSEVMPLRSYALPHDMALDMTRCTLRHTLWARLIRRSLYTDHAISAQEGINIGEDLQVMSRLAFFASRMANCYRLVYHYNCTNERSYVHASDDVERNCRKAEQDLASYQNVRDFFLDKDEACAEEAKQNVRRFAESILRSCVILRDRNRYNLYKSLIYNKMRGGG